VADQVFEPIIPCLARIVRPRLTLNLGVIKHSVWRAGKAEAGSGSLYFFRHFSFAQMTRKKRRYGTRLVWNGKYVEWE